jgi:hypothetical protein
MAREVCVANFYRIRAARKVIAFLEAVALFRRFKNSAERVMKKEAGTRCGLLLVYLIGVT